jgi:hypothetical protein
MRCRAGHDLPAKQVMASYLLSWAGLWPAHQAGHCLLSEQVMTFLPIRSWPAWWAGQGHLCRQVVISSPSRQWLAWWAGNGLPAKQVVAYSVTRSWPVWWAAHDLLGGQVTTTHQVSCSLLGELWSAWYLPAKQFMVSYLLGGQAFTSSPCKLCPAWWASHNCSLSILLDGKVVDSMP